MGSLQYSCMALWDDEVDAEVSQGLTAKATAPATTAAAGPAEEPDEPSSIFQGFFTLPPHHTSSKAISPVASLAMSTAPALCSLQLATAFQHAKDLQEPTDRHIPHDCVKPGKETGLQAFLITSSSALLREPTLLACHMPKPAYNKYKSKVLIHNAWCILMSLLSCKELITFYRRLHQCPASGSCTQAPPRSSCNPPLR